jgi:hypothetical protein
MLGVFRMLGALRRQLLFDASCFSTPGAFQPLKDELV